MRKTGGSLDHRDRNESPFRSPRYGDSVIGMDLGGLGVWRVFGLALEGRAPDLARNVVGGAIVGAFKDGSPAGSNSGGGVAILLLEAAKLLDDLVLVEVELQPRADLVEEGTGVVLIVGVRSPPPGRELVESLQHLYFVGVSPELLKHATRLLGGAGVGSPPPIPFDDSEVLAVGGFVAPIAVNPADDGCGMIVSGGRHEWD